ncbi:MAG: sporulation protein YunB [Clostridia bacterium]|nr:sporulation protein YunB [Clostridia bacterium]MBQ6704125.1 sporulation protein YunB [Clostridia bacterium]
MEERTLHRRRRRPLKILLLGSCTACICFVALLFTVNANMRPALTAIAEARVTALAVSAMNDAIMERMDDNSYTSLITAYDNGEKVYMIQADTRQMNMLASDCCAAAQMRIAAMGEQGVSVPLGTVSGITYLSGRGPGIRVTFTPVGSVESDFDSELVSSGINQSLYRVNIRLTSTIRLIMPGVSHSIEVNAKAAIAESIIVGDVPQVYTNVADKEDMMNLIPTEPLS